MTDFLKNSASIADRSPDDDLPFLYVALPVMDEPDYLPNTLECFSRQTYRKFRLVVCVNQPDAWWHDPLRVAACKNNQQTILYLNGWKGADCTVLDYSSPGLGWKGKRHGVGFARKTVMDDISRMAGPGDIIVSMDADTEFEEDYLRSVAENFACHPGYTACSVPYYHRLTGQDAEDRAMLRYEIYMRYYFLQMARIGSPFVFTALGSAMAVPVSAYRAIGGMTPKMSGEDFYFLQKLRKYGDIGLWNAVVVHPASRFSDRVYFGTGPAMIQGAQGDWSSYPVYPSALFDMIADTYAMLPELFIKTVSVPVVDFIAEIFREEDPFQPLRENHKRLNRFIRAFHEKFDGLRILQFLKSHHQPSELSDERNLAGFITRFYPEKALLVPEILDPGFSFKAVTIEDLDRIRDLLFELEMQVRVSSVPG